MTSAKSVSRLRDQLNVRLARTSTREYVGSLSVLRVADTKYYVPLLLVISRRRHVRSAADLRAQVGPIGDSDDRYRLTAWR